MPPRARLAFALLAVAASARLLLQVAVMPPYAGLDELFHVARLAFRAAEGRDPVDAEKSMPPYLASALYESSTGTPPNRPAVLPSFAQAGPHWPGMVQRGLRVHGEVPLEGKELLPYVERNYEAQHPALYYATHAPLATAFGPRTAAGELRTWRRASIGFALITVLATAWVGWRLFGTVGMLAGALLVSLPTWQTIVARASNDAFACAALAVAVALTAGAPDRLRGWMAEAVAWGIACAAKLYSWPLLPLLPLFWRRQRAARARRVIVTTVAAVAVVATMIELRSRTSNPLGLFLFDPVKVSAPARVPIDVAGIVKITIATGIWTSGQHGNALTALGMASYALPLAALLIAGLLAARRADPAIRPLLGLVLVGMLLFGFAQLVTLAAYLRQAIAAGEALPAGGKEGWYWYTLAPLVIGIGLAAALRGLQSRWRVLLLALVLLIAGWDVVISEGALFRDYAGMTSPATPSVLFRWGSSASAATLFDERLAALTVDPLSSAATGLRVVHLLALAALTMLVLRESRRSADGSGEDPLRVSVREEP